MARPRRLLVTGGAGFIGSAYVRRRAAAGDHVTVLDALTYAGNLDNLAAVRDAIDFRRVDIRDGEAVAAAMGDANPDVVVHCAAESHVDRSITGPGVFVDTNVRGTLNLLDATRAHAEGKPVRFVHVSTDEVFGALRPGDPAFTEETPYAPNSPYSASKAASDHLVRAYHHTYGLDTVTTHCSNNYGACQFPEKLIPRMILACLDGEALPVYGAGDQIRDWLHVDDHCAAIDTAIDHAAAGATLNIGGDAERTNLEVIHAICDALDAARPRSDGASHRAGITHVDDRLGHDFRYAVDASRMKALGWAPTRTFEAGLAETVRWYLDNPDWIGRARSGAYRETEVAA